MISCFIMLFQLICMPWRAMISCFICFFYWYVCPDGQLFFASYAFSIDMYALTGNDFLLHMLFLLICMPWRAIVFCFICFFCWYVCPDGQWFLASYAFSVDMYALTGNDFLLYILFLLMCMPWRAMLDYRSMLSIDMYALTGNCFFASLCFFYWYVCPNGQWFDWIRAFVNSP